MAVITQATHVERLNENTKEVLRLVDIHEELTGEEPGRRRGVEVLNKSGVVLLCACWEAFVEDLASEAFAVLLHRAKDHTVFPPKVLALASRDLRESDDTREVWKLAGSGWQAVLKEHRDSIIAKHCDRFHSPKAARVDALFAELLDVGRVSTSWSWKGNSAAMSRKRIDTLIDLRNEIAHRVRPARAVKKTYLVTSTALIYWLAVCSHNHIHGHVRKLTGGEVWPRLRFGAAR